jgi:hypothetical protein
VSDFLTQAAWAERFGVTTRTFLRWRRAGRIPAPDLVVSSIPRWSIKVVNQTMRRLTRVEPRGFGQKGVEFLKARAQRGANHAQLGQVARRQAVGDVHARSVAKSPAGAQRNSIAGMR